MTLILKSCLIIGQCLSSNRFYTTLPCIVTVGGFKKLIEEKLSLLLWIRLHVNVQNDKM